jgi:hypothetical protein
MLAFLAAAVALTAPSPEMASARSDASTRLQALARPDACGYFLTRPVARRAPGGRAQTLGELPPANLELTVLRFDEKGCSKPVIVRQNVSGDGRFAKPRD